MVAERSAADMKMLNKHVGMIYYHLCPDDKRFFRTIRIHHNTFTNSTQPQASNPVYGTPPKKEKLVMHLREEGESLRGLREQTGLAVEMIRKMIERNKEVAAA